MAVLERDDSDRMQEGQEILEGRFKIIKKLGSGAFGEIFKGKSAGTTGLARLNAHFQSLGQTLS